MKNEAIKHLESLAIAEGMRKYPSFPLSHFTATRKYSEKNANQLTKCVIDWLKFNGHFAERINSMGVPRDTRQIVTNCIGQQRQIGKMKWTRSSSTKGSADIHSVINGKAFFFEIKKGRDFQSIAQKEYQRNVERAGATYIIVKTFEDFYNWYKKQSTALTVLN